MPDARRTTPLSPSPATARSAGRRLAVPPSMGPRREAGREGADEPSPELIGLLGRLRAALVGYVGGRRGEGATFERVLAEVQDLARAAAAAEGWCDLTDLLVPQATCWTREAYAAGPAGAPVPPWSAAAAPDPRWA